MHKNQNRRKRRNSNRVKKMTKKIKFETEIDKKLQEEIDFWNLNTQELIKESIQHSMWGAIRRKTDNLCKKCKKPIIASIPPQNRTRANYPKGFCECK
jgi:hypothetical protein